MPKTLQTIIADASLDTSHNLDANHSLDTGRSPVEKKLTNGYAQLSNLSTKTPSPTLVVSSTQKSPKKQMKFINRELDRGMGKAVARRTYLRKVQNQETGRERWETWQEVATRVSAGNAMLIANFPDAKIKNIQKHRQAEQKLLQKHINNASMLMSGRHLQHGDLTQIDRNMEVFTNCSTASSSYILFYLLMNGSGVGRAYDDDMCVVNWDNMPNVRCVIAENHPDFEWGVDESVKDAEHKYGRGENIHWFHVPDSREGWAQAIEMLEIMAYEKKHKDGLLILDFSKVREKGAPIKGMQNRPSSGPKPLMNAIKKLASIKGADMSPWKQAMFADHYLAECVLVGGARRSARIATKVWTDPEVLDFISIKRGGFLWSANNSITVDEKFWKQKSSHARKVLEAILRASYEDGTGEPGFINQHRLVQNDEGYDSYQDGSYAESEKYQPLKNTKKMLKHLARNAEAKIYCQIPNPCGEISLNMLGGYCVIGDVVPYFAPTLDDAEEAFRAMTRALIRVNSMNCLYNKEVKRTNRIGVGMTGIHEFAWNMFGYDFRDLIDEQKSQDFWQTMARYKRAVTEEAVEYSTKLGVNVPHTNTTIKPSGTVSKLFALTEGAHLPSMREYLRWVQYRGDDPQVKKYQKKGYPIKELRSYQGTTAVGFPTQPMICRLGMGDRLVTAGEATPQEQYRWLMLLEKYWIVGLDEDGQPLEDNGNQVSYTLKYDPKKVSFAEYKEMVVENQSKVKVCSVMPQQDTTAYEYQPEEPVTISEFMKVLNEIAAEEEVMEDIDFEHLKCESGACPI